MELYNPFPGARWVRYSLIYISERDAGKFADEFVFVMTEMKWRKIPFE